MGKIMDEDLRNYLTTHYSFSLGSPNQLYDEDMKNIVLRAKEMSSSPHNVVTKATLIRAFKQYCRDHGLSIKIETFLRKLRHYASERKYISYTYKKGLYKVLI